MKINFTPPFPRVFLNGTTERISVVTYYQEIQDQNDKVQVLYFSLRIKFCYLTVSEMMVELEIAKIEKKEI